MGSSPLADAIRSTTSERLDAGGWDAIIVGAGAAGGWAAELLTGAGLKVLLLDAGRRPSILEAPFRRTVAATMSRLANPDALPFISPGLLHKGRRAMRVVGRVRQPVQTECFAWERRPDAFVDDRDVPYETPPDRPFTWIRARALEGRMGIPGHGRQYLRFSADDFAPSDGLSPPWPLAPGELDPFYVQVERRLGMAGEANGLPWLPDSELAHRLEPTAAEAGLMETIRRAWPNARPILGRYAPPPDTLKVAAATGGLALRQGAIVHGIEVGNGRARGVRWHDEIDRKQRRAEAPIVFLCASSLETTRILMLSSDAATGRAIGSGSSALGRYLMDHVMIKAEGLGGALPGPRPVRMEDGRCVYLPRFDARDAETPPHRRGYGVQLYQASIGGGGSFFTGVAFSEMVPRAENHVRLHPGRVDRWGVPILYIDCAYGETEKALAADQTAAMREIAAAMGVSLYRLDEAPFPPGIAIHESGTARMGRDPETSVVDPNNQCWDARGLYVTDSASFPSQGSQNPTLTVMALTARACAHALKAA